ncbi:ATP-grasp domain-containing protein [Microvirga lotononidis]|uniref:ATP-grasp domain-containing protein n=1 Tax=Microvirga lotononidis TaxID=864069 RepID=UPI00058F7DAA|nr:ATP-grasp domain-containing protein [Microvirga lotononidis]
MAAVVLDLMVQEAIPGPESRIESYHVYVDQTNATAAEFTGRKIRTFPLSCGHSTALETTDCADVRALGRDIVQKIGLRGVAKLDFKREPNGELHLLEINPRFSLWHHLGAIAGVNMPA